MKTLFLLPLALLSPIAAKADALRDRLHDDARYDRLEEAAGDTAIVHGPSFLVEGARTFFHSYSRATAACRMMGLGEASFASVGLLDAGTPYMLATDVKGENIPKQLRSRERVGAIRWVQCKIPPPRKTEDPELQKALAAKNITAEKVIRDKDGSVTIEYPSLTYKERTLPFGLLDPASKRSGVSSQAEGTAFVNELNAESMKLFCATAGFGAVKKFDYNRRTPHISAFRYTRIADGTVAPVGMAAEFGVARVTCAPRTVRAYGTSAREEAEINSGNAL